MACQVSIPVRDKDDTPVIIDAVVTIRLDSVARTSDIAGLTERVNHLMDNMSALVEDRG